MPVKYGYSLKPSRGSRMSQLSDIINRDHQSCRFVVEMHTGLVLFATSLAQKKFQKIDCKNGIGHQIASIIQKSGRAYYKDDLQATRAFMQAFEEIQKHFQKPKHRLTRVMTQHHFQWRKVMRELRVFVELFFNEDQQPVAYLVTLKEAVPIALG